MSFIGCFQLDDYTEEGAIRPWELNRIGCVLDGENPQPKTLVHSDLWEPGPDDTGTSVLGDNAVRHLKIEELCVPNIRTSARTVVPSFSGWWDDGNGWKGFWAWESNSDSFYYLSCQICPSSGYYHHRSFYVSRDTSTWEWWGGQPRCGYGEMVTRTNMWGEQVMIDHVYQTWEYLKQRCNDRGYLMTMKSRFSYWTEGLVDINYLSVVQGDISDFFKKWFPDNTDVNAAKVALINESIEKLEVSDNNIQNLREFASLVNDLRNGKISKLYADYQKLFRPNERDIKKSLSRRVGEVTADNWLAYRYQYKTTVSDINQFIEAASRGYLKRIENQTLAHPLRAGGTFNGETWHLKCRLHESNRDPFMALAERMRRFGVLPDFHVLWDMVPFSFAVDWFIPVDDFLSSFDRWWYSQGYQFDELLFSRKRQKNLVIAGNQLHLTEYSRWLDFDVAPFSYTQEDPGGCNLVSFNREADSLSLMISMMP